MMKFVGMLPGQLLCVLLMRPLLQKYANLGNIFNDISCVWYVTKLVYHHWQIVIYGSSMILLW